MYKILLPYEFLNDNKFRLLLILFFSVTLYICMSTMNLPNVTTTKVTSYTIYPDGSNKTNYDTQVVYLNQGVHDVLTVISIVMVGITLVILCKAIQEWQDMAGW